MPSPMLSRAGTSTGGSSIINSPPDAVTCVVGRPSMVANGSSDARVELVKNAASAQRRRVRMGPN
jgi:hypothetical protein